MNILSINIRGMGGGAKASWIKEIRLSNRVGAITIQESNVDSVGVADLVGYWGNRNFAFALVDAVGLSGALIWIWDPKVLKIESVIKKRYFLIIKGSSVGSGDQINLLNVCAPQRTPKKLSLWNDISGSINFSNGKWIIAGGFNAVRTPEERKKSKFKQVCAENFNKFIYDSELLKFPMQGREFTCIRDNGKKLSKLDRFLVCPNFFNKWSSLFVRVLPGRFSDHCPILLETVELNFGSRLFRVFSSWIGKPGFEDAVKEVVEGFVNFDPPDASLTAKFAQIRSRLKVWRDDFIAKEGEQVKSALAKLEQLERDFEDRDLSEEEEEWIMAENKRVVREKASILIKELD